MERTPTHDTVWSVDDAVAFLRGEQRSGTTEWKQFCLRLSARAYGYASSNVADVQRDGDHDVADYWEQASPEFKHEDDRNPPLGALAIFGNPGRFGHIAVVVRSDDRGVLVLANDDLDRGRVRPLSLSSIESGLNLDYLGWVEPHYPQATVGNPKGLPAGKNPETVFLQALFFGNKNSESVRLLQRRLGRLLGDDLGTGEYDKATKRAVSTFQRRCCRFSGSGADGFLWDRDTQSGGEMTTALLLPKQRFVVKRGAVPDSDVRIVVAADERAQPEPTPQSIRPLAGLPIVDPDEPDPAKPAVDLAKLVPGLKNQSVRRLQRRLNRVIDAGLTETGQYDDATVAVVQAWQIAIGDVDDADGVLGPKQFARLFPLRRFKRVGGPPGRLTLSSKGEEFIIEFEGFSSTLYNDQAGHCSIGVGHLVHRGNCKKAEGGLEKGITKAKAIALMRSDARSKIDSVATSVKVPLTQEQFDALVSFTFNVGEHNFETSTLLEKLNAGDSAAVPGELARWNKVTINGRKVASKGLTRRREREGKLFATGVYTA